MPSQWSAALLFPSGAFLASEFCPAVSLARESGCGDHGGAATALRQGDRLISDGLPRCQRNTRCIDLGVVQSRATSCDCSLPARGILLSSCIAFYMPPSAYESLFLPLYDFHSLRHYHRIDAIAALSLFQSFYSHLGGTLSALQP
jgi:hypothetical protein